MFKSILSQMSLLGILTVSSFAQASGPNTPPVGSIVPEEISFTLANSTAAQLNGGGSLGALSLTDYTQFEGQVVAAVYHASW